MKPETEFDLANVDTELLEAATIELSTPDNGSNSSYPPSCDKGGGWEA